MKRKYLRFLLPPLVAAGASAAFAQDIGRVSPASLPLPLPAAAPMPPDQLRAHSPWNLPMTGTWRVFGRETIVGGPTLNLGEARGKNKGADDKGIYRADQPPSINDAHLVTKPGADGAMQVAVTTTVHAAAVPLVGRAEAGAKGTVLFASRELAADYGLSRQWATDHNIHAVKSKPLFGSFTPCVINARGLAAAQTK